MRHLPERVIRVAEAALARVGRRVLMRPLIARRRSSFSRGGCTTPVERADRLLGDRRGAPADRPSRVGVYLFGRLAQIAANERRTTPLFPERQPERLVPERTGTGVANARILLTAQ